MSVGKPSVPLAKKLLSVVPPAMHLIREELRASVGSGWTVPQLRILAGVSRGFESVTELADHLGVSQPSASKMVDGLVGKKLLARSHDKEDRRRTRLALTAEGRRLFESGQNKVLMRLAKTIDRLSPAGKKRLAEGLDELDELFVLLSAEE